MKGNVGCKRGALCKLKFLAINEYIFQNSLVFALYIF